MAQSVGRGGGGGGRVIGEYSVGKQIGSGSFSVVWHARHRVHGTEVAIKEISMARLNKKLQESLLSEIVILKQINHPNIIRLHDIIEVPGKIHLVLEYCRGGDLFMHIQRHGRVTEATAKHFMQQLAAGLLVLRKNDLIHRDLKPQNLLLSTNDNNSVLKIADFGFARSLQPRGLAETLCGSPLYMAPEIMQLQKYDAKADLWSVGTILFQLVTGRTPFTGNNQMQLLQNIIKSTELRFPSEIKNLSSECIDLCRKLLRRNPVERLTFDEFFNHTFLSAKLPDEKLKSKKPSQSTEIFPLSECHNLENRVQSSQEDCLPFLFDDDSSGPDGSPPFAGRRSSMKPLRGFALEPRREMLSNSMKNVDAVSQDGNVINEMERCGFRLDNDKTRQPSTKMDYRPGNPCSRVMDSLEFIDQEYVIVSGPPLDGSSTTTSISKPHLSPSPFPASVDVNSICSVPMTIGCPVGNPCHVGSLDSQCSIPSGTSHGSMDIGDASEQTSGNSLSRIKSLQHCAAIIKELLSKKIEACRYLEAFSIQLVILAIWKQALDIYHTQAVSSIEVSSTQDSARIKASMDCKISSPGVHGCFDGLNSKLLDDIFFEIKAEFFEDVEYAEELSKFIEPGNTEMPDAMETIYQAALSLGRSGAVDELMENMESAVSSYSKAVRLLVFLLVEAPSLLLNPPFSLTNSDRFRLRNYINILNDRQGHSRSQRMNLFKPEDQQCKTLR